MILVRMIGFGYNLNTALTKYNISHEFYIDDLKLNTTTYDQLEYLILLVE